MQIKGILKNVFMLHISEKNTVRHLLYIYKHTACPIRYRTRHFFNNFTTNEDIATQQLGALQTNTTDTFLFISHTTNVLIFNFRCNIFIGVRIIKEMPSSVASGTHCVCVCVYICVCVCVYIYIYTVCPTRYRTRHFFNNFTTNEDIATQQLGALQTHSSSFLTQRTYSCSNFVAISSLVLELLKKCRVR